INQVPHTDHCVWLPVCLQAYLDETGDDAILDEVGAGVVGARASVAERIDRAMHWLLAQRDERDPTDAAQGHGSDPVTMVGWKGGGVSGWLPLASAYALRLWADISARHGRPHAVFREGADAFNAAVNARLRDGDWYGRGSTGDGVVF